MRVVCEINTQLTYKSLSIKNYIQQPPDSRGATKAKLNSFMETQPNVCYSIKQYNQKNRVMLASREIKQAQIILQSKPIAWAVLSHLRDKFCSFCLQKGEVKRCSACATLYYCSIQCQRGDWAVHKTQCKAYSKITKEKKFKITSEFVLLARCYLAYKSNNTKAQAALNTLLDLNDYQPQEKRLYFRDLAVCLLENFELQKSADNMGLLISLANKIAVNTFTIQDYLFDYDGVGIGLYHPANFMNHSCRPNAVQIFDGKNIKVIALNHIDKDEQINISYIDELLQLKTRNSLLRTNYLFDCGCLQCMAEKAVKIQYLSLLCECGEGNLVTTAEKETMKCNVCSKTYSQQKITQIKQDIEKHKLELVKESVPYETMVKSFFALKKLLRFRDPWFSKVLQNIYLAALTKANQETDPVKQDKHYRDAYKILKALVFNFRVWYRMEEGQEFHVLLMWKYSQLGKLAMHLGKIRKAVTYTEKAVEMLKKCKLRKDLQEVKALLQRSQRLAIECRMNVSGKP